MFKKAVTILVPNHFSCFIIWIGFLLVLLFYALEFFQHGFLVKEKKNFGPSMAVVKWYRNEV